MPGPVTLIPQNEAPRIAFGLDAVGVLSGALSADFGAVWIGAWVQEHGWGEQDEQFLALRAQGVTPFVQLYYWGDDLDPACFEDGCWSSLHPAYKDQDGWNKTVDALIDHLWIGLEGERVVVVLETEFNKATMVGYGALDTALAAQADRIHAGYPNATVVLGFGNWYLDGWKDWPLATAAVDAVGVQLVAAVPAVDESYTRLVEGVIHAGVIFELPIYVHDVALSTYDGQEEAQKELLAHVIDGRNTLSDAGVVAIVYRAWSDDPHASVMNHFGEAERHMGLVRADGSEKPAAAVWQEAFGTR